MLVVTKNNFLINSVEFSSVSIQDQQCVKFADNKIEDTIIFFNLFTARFIIFSFFTKKLLKSLERKKK